MGILQVHPDVRTALRERCPVVALESTLITHGLPFPINLETARAAEAAVRAADAVPATIAVLRGEVRIGLHAAELAELAECKDARKASRRDLGFAIAEGLTAGTTVSATMFLAHRSGIRVFATGGIGGVHPEAEGWDVSADLLELARTPVAVVCAGAKSILDLGRTLEFLETQAVPVVGYGTSEFPAFYLTTSGRPLDMRADTPPQAAAILRAHWQLSGGGVVIAQPPPPHLALDAEEWAEALQQAEAEAREANISGKRLTPFLLGRLALHTGGKTLRLNQELVVANAGLAGRIAAELVREG
jgi:pseudouridine-5'-phosphate glycosidase